jgi:hypothetical protein
MRLRSFIDGWIVAASGLPGQFNFGAIADTLVSKATYQCRSPEAVTMRPLPKGAQFVHFLLGGTARAFSND